MHSGCAPDDLRQLMNEGVIEHFVAKPGHTIVAELCSKLLDESGCSSS